MTFNHYLMSMFSLGEEEEVVDDPAVPISAFGRLELSDGFASDNGYGYGYGYPDLSAIGELDNEDLMYDAHKKKQPKIYGKYMFGALIGEGAYGKVKEVLDVTSLQRYAVKIMKRIRRIIGGPDHVRKEIMLLKRLNHVNVIRLQDAFYKHDKQKIYVVLEFCHGNMQSLLKSAPGEKLPLWQAHLYFAQLLQALEYIHSQGVIHRDVKPGNMLLTANDQLKLADFGVADVLQRFVAEPLCESSAGTPTFQSPEIAAGLKQFDGTKVDVWASGVTLWNMLTGSYPFDGDSLFGLFNAIGLGQYDMPEGLPETVQDLLRNMLRRNAAERYSVHQAQSHRFMKKPPARTETKVELPCSEDNPHGSSSLAPILDEYYSFLQDGYASDEDYLIVENTSVLSNSVLSSPRSSRIQEQTNTQEQGQEGRPRTSSDGNIGVEEQPRSQVQHQRSRSHGGFRRFFSSLVSERGSRPSSRSASGHVSEAEEAADTHNILVKLAQRHDRIAAAASSAPPSPSHVSTRRASDPAGLSLSNPEHGRHAEALSSREVSMRALKFAASQHVGSTDI